MSVVDAAGMEQTIAAKLYSTSYPCDLSRSQVASLLGGDFPLGTPTADTAFRALQSEGGLIFHGDEVKYVTLKDGAHFGPERLVRRFCRRYYGEVSPLVDRKMMQAVLKRHGANFELESPPVKSTLEKLQGSGLIRLLGKDEAFIKMLGAE